MIKCNVTVCGTVSRQAQIRANKEGKQFISFGVKVVIPAKSGINKTIEISVAKDTDNQGEAVNHRLLQPLRYRCEQLQRQYSGCYHWHHGVPWYHRETG